MVQESHFDILREVQGLWLQREASVEKRSQGLKLLEARKEEFDRPLPLHAPTRNSFGKQLSAGIGCSSVQLVHARQGSDWHEIPGASENPWIKITQRGTKDSSWDIPKTPLGHH